MGIGKIIGVLQRYDHENLYVSYRLNVAYYKDWLLEEKKSKIIGFKTNDFFRGSIGRKLNNFSRYHFFVVSLDDKVI